MSTDDLIDKLRSVGGLTVDPLDTPYLADLTDHAAARIAEVERERDEARAELAQVAITGNKGHYVTPEADHARSLITLRRERDEARAQRDAALRVAKQYLGDKYHEDFARLMEMWEVEQ